MTTKTIASVGLALILTALATNSHAKTSVIAEFDRHAYEGRGFVSQQREAARVTKRVHHKRERRLKDRPETPQNYAEPGPSAPLVETARRYIGQTAAQLGLPRSLWCADFIAKIAPAVARRVDNPRWARDYAELPRTGPQVGAIVVLTRGRGGHIGVVVGFDRRGNPLVISGNHGHRVAEGVYSKSRVIAYVSGG